MHITCLFHIFTLIGCTSAVIANSLDPKCDLRTIALGSKRCQMYRSRANGPSGQCGAIQLRIRILRK